MANDNERNRRIRNALIFGAAAALVAAGGYNKFIKTKEDDDTWEPKSTGDDECDCCCGKCSRHDDCSE